MTTILDFPAPARAHGSGAVAVRLAPMQQAAIARLADVIAGLDSLARMPGFRFAATMAAAYRTARDELAALEPGSPLLRQRVEDLAAELQDLREVLGRTAPALDPDLDAGSALDREIGNAEIRADRLPTPG